MDELEQTIKSIIESAESIETTDYPEMERILESILKKLSPTDEEDRDRDSL